MNSRVLELLKDPKHIQSEDLHLLKEEINSFPYIQNIRALHLYGIHLFDRENYQKELSTTAAYTTDKKILYQLINGKIQQRPKQEVIEEKEVIEPKTEQKKTFEAKNAFNYIYQKSSFPLKREEKQDEVIDSIVIPGNEIKKPVEVQKESDAVIHETLKENKYEEASCLLQTNPQPEIKHVYINGERNRILFEGEENFLEDKNAETIDLESTLESGTIVTQKPANQETVQLAVDENNMQSMIEEDKEEIAVFTPETMIDEDKISSHAEKEKVEDRSELSFHETEPLLPEITVDSNEAEEFENVSNGTEDQKAEEIAEFTPETIINEDKIDSETEKEIIDKGSELSFHGTESFLPDVKIQSNSIEEGKSEAPLSNINKHEDEMRRLIQDVERKMKESKNIIPARKKEETEHDMSHDISFAETQSFEVKPEEKEVELPDNNKTAREIVEERKEEIQETSVEVESDVKSAWKPMSFESHIPDSLLNKKTETSQSTVETPVIETSQVETAQKEKEILPEIEEITELAEGQSEVFSSENVGLKIDDEAPKTVMSNKEDVPVMNVSFFGSDISSWKPKEFVKEDLESEPEEEIQDIPAAEALIPRNLDSNIPGFINTWQNWLKIDRADETEKEKVEIKTKAIETFIENNPRISQLKDESSFVVKERTDDISHLMTETLANLYIEQKLYTKANKAFEILIKKHPEKKQYFEAKLQEIKDIRNKN
ncbi:hypothetical protein ACM39_00710 [Chryseobacterium sp. FH2]|uniref:hypothetical protein n=1 Tax=Chryseobacterium sp. FH2 TaxID=1674291 RepID=UPI00065AB09B|nr:hypothetical protein [Chryseobacterium sp. FH2]KMQ69620.1 hypothetical protein ACM39_00710 [Chryseobacterium sp. FH2]